MTQRESPTLRRRQLAALLRRYREAQGFTVSEVAQALLCSPSKISRIETGRRAGTLRDVRDLSQLYQLKESERDQLMELARESREQGWWQHYAMPSSIGTYVGLEAAADTICNFELAVIPGLLQTEQYAHAVFNAVRPDLTDERIAQAVQIRLARQQLLTYESPPRFEAILDEAVLHRLVGGVAVMHAQLVRLVELAWQEQITVRVVPYSAGAHPALVNAFTLLGFADSPEIAYIESATGNLFVEQPEDVARYREAFKQLRGVALDPGESVRLIEEIAANQEHFGPAQEATAL